MASGGIFAMSKGVTDQSSCTANSTGALRFTSFLMACIDCASSGLMTRIASSAEASCEPSRYGVWRSSRRMVCVSDRSSSSSMTWRTLVSDGVADMVCLMAGICTVGSAGGAFGAGATPEAKAQSLWRQSSALPQAAWPARADWQRLGWQQQDSQQQAWQRQAE